MSEIKSIEILVPVFNEEDSIEILVSALLPMVEKFDYKFSLTLIDDGSTDSTYQIACSISSISTKVIKLSRNFGKENAVQCGIDDSDADALILLDADLQDPISLIPMFIAEWESGHDIVYGIRDNRDIDSFQKRISSSIFYYFFLKFSNVKFPPHTSDARLMSKKVIRALKEMRESQRFNKGLFHEVGFKSIGVKYTRESRSYSKSKFGVSKLFGLAKNAFLGFTLKPLYWSIYAGASTALFSIILAAYYGSRKVFLGDAPSGFTTIIVGILFLGAMQLLSVGIIGIYLANVVTESKKRPLYFVAEKHISATKEN